jgi:hypothetical protein
MSSPHLIPAISPSTGNPATSPATRNRAERALALRVGEAGGDAFGPQPPQIDNGDEALYTDKSGTYTKGILQTGIGLVDLAAYATFQRALRSGNPADFADIITGGPRTQNGPQGGLAFELECLDSIQFTSPPAPALASEEYATELIELYWASLLRDVAFTDYPGNATAIAAAKELTSLPAYKGPRDSGGNVTPQFLFRGGLADGTFAGETIGPYLSQFLLEAASLGALPIVQKYNTLRAGVDYMLDPASFQAVQNGAIPTPPSLQPPLYLHNGRGLASYTHIDVLYQAYFIAYLVLNTIGAPVNPGNPYVGSKTQNGFGTMGQPDFAATLAAVAREALNVVWFQKWWVHLRHRPESGGALVYLNQTGHGSTVQGKPSNTVLNSNAVKASFAKNNSYFLAQAFPEGSPTHPAYPTGHGTVAGACITALKFFFDGSFQVPNPVVPSDDGTTLQPYTGSDAGQLNVNGELHKLAHNISFGHGIHAGIHWRSDTDTSIQLGETVALSILRDRAQAYNEKFTITLTKVDGSTATISNM